MLIIDGERFAVEVEKLTRKADFLDKYAERTEDGDLKRELIGVYFNYTLQLFAGSRTSEYSRLWDKLTEPVEFHEVTVPDSDGDYTFTAYFPALGFGRRARFVPRPPAQRRAVSVHLLPAFAGRL